ncbi:MAG: alpha/beta fold hydrolase [bacterium]
MQTTDGVLLHGAYWPPRGPVVPASYADEPAPAYALAHGFTGSSARPHVRAICRRLSGRGAAVAVVDQRGHGASGGLTSVGVDEERDLAAVVEHLRARGHQRVVALGFSMGASVAIRFAAYSAGPRGAGIAAAVAVSGPALWYERGTHAMRVLHQGVETALGRIVVRRLSRTRVGVTGWDALPLSPLELVARIAPTPLLIVHGDADRYFPLRHACALAAAASEADLWVEPGMGHAEAATTPELVDRIDAWVRGALRRSSTLRALPDSARSVTMAR